VLVLLLLSAALADSYLVSTTTTFPHPLKLAGGAHSQQVQLELVLDCGDEGCVIADFAVKARPTPGLEGELLPALEALDERVSGASVELEPYLLDGQPSDEALLSRAFAGFEHMDAMEGRSSTMGSLLAELPLASSSHLVEVKHHTTGSIRESNGVGRIDTAGAAYVFRSRVTSTYEQDQLVERRWWAVAERADASREPAYLQGGYLRRLEDGERAELHATEELQGSPEGVSWEVLQAGLAVYQTQDAELPREPGSGPNLWVSTVGAVSVRASHDMVASGGLALGANLDGLWFGVEGWSHAPRNYRPFGIVGARRAFPVHMVDVYGLLGYRPEGVVWHPAVGVLWGTSLRWYSGAEPDFLVLPLGGAEVRLGVSPTDRLTLELIGRALFDGAATKVTRGQELGSLSLVSAMVGIGITGELVDL